MRTRTTKTALSSNIYDLLQRFIYDANDDDGFCTFTWANILIEFVILLAFTLPRSLARAHLLKHASQCIYIYSQQIEFEYPLSAWAIGQMHE